MSIHRSQQTFLKKSKAVRSEFAKYQLPGIYNTCRNTKKQKKQKQKGKKR